MDYENMSKEELIQVLKDAKELNQKLLDLMELQNHKATELSIKILEEQLKIRHKFLTTLEDNEHSKLFKNSHSDLENKIHYTKKYIEYRPSYALNYKTQIEYRTLLGFK